MTLLLEWTFRIVLGFAFLRWVVALINLITWPVLAERKSETKPLISILVPARNEESTLPSLLKQLHHLSYPHLEFIILNDQSEDNTAQILEEGKQKETRLHVIEGKPLPPDWLGKPWACHQLAKMAKGDYFLFLDADIANMSPVFPAALIAEMNTRPTALLSIFPRQIMRSIGEKMVVPNLHELFLSMLPVFLIRRSRLPSLSAANGQCMFFEAKAYQAEQWHKQVRHEIIEDIAIMKQVKSKGFTGATLLAGNLLSCRMYNSLSEGIAGFSKNMLSGFGGSVTGLMVYLWFISLGWGLPWFSIDLQWYGLALLLIMSRRMFTSILSGQSVWGNLLLHPAQIAVMVYIGARSVIHTYSGTITWKGRNVA